MSGGTVSGTAKSAGAPVSEAEREARPLGTPRIRAGVYVALAVLGLLVGVAGTLVQAGWFPFGLLLSLAASAGLFWGGAKLCRTKAGAIAPAAGWAVAVLFLTSSRPEGDFLFGIGVGSYVFLIGGMLVAVMCATIALPVPPGPGNKSR